MKTLLLLLALSPAAAQEAAPSLAPAMRLDPGKDKKKAPPKTPLGLALSLSFPQATWAKLGVSTAAPAADMDRLLAAGFYRLELVQLIMMADEIGARLSELTVQRQKVKKSLREIAGAAKIDYDALYERALAQARRVQARAHEFSRVRVRRKEDE